MVSPFRGYTNRSPWPYNLERVIDFFLIAYKRNIFETGWRLLERSGGNHERGLSFKFNLINITFAYPWEER